MESPRWSELLMVVESERSEIVRSETVDEDNYVILNENDYDLEVPENEKVVNVRKRKKHYSGPRKNKKLCTFEEVSYETVKNLSNKTLVDRYALLTADEMNKKYFYKCRLLPKKCEQSYESYGNEIKALQLIKAHLREHIAELKVSPKETTPSTSTTISDVKDILKRPKKLSRTVSKRNVLVQKPTFSGRGFKNVSESCSAKKGLNFSCTLNTSNNVTDVDKGETSFKYSYIFAQPAVHIRDFISPAPPEVIISTESEPYFSEPSVSYHTFTPEISEDITQCIGDNSSNDVSDDVMSSPDYTICHDHKYMSADPVKVIKHPLEKKRNNNLTLEKMMERNLFPEQFVIKTPYYPQIHEPYSIKVSEVKELSEDGIPIVHGRLEGPVQHPPYEEDTKVKKTFQLSSKKRSFLSFEKQDVTGQVLECVENKANIKPSAADSTSKNLQDFANIDTEEDTDENAENLQKSQVEREKEQALKFIAKLNARKKKKIKGPLSCEICSKKFTAPATLMHHYRSHARLKDYKCSQCDAEFTRQHSLKYHDMIHSGKSRFSCPHCIRKFRHPSHFKEHLRRHTGETPFYCKDCNSHFKTRNTFKRHLRAKHSKVLSADGIQDAVSDKN